MTISIGEMIARTVFLIFAFGGIYSFLQGLWVMATSEKQFWAGLFVSLGGFIAASIGFAIAFAANPNAGTLPGA